jgi:hypothetical protein
VAEKRRERKKEAEKLLLAEVHEKRGKADVDVKQ